MSDFVEVLVENDALTLEEEVVEALEAAFEGWEPAEGNLETFLIKAFARIASTNREQAARISKEAFKRFGESVVNVPPVQAAPATVPSTWTMIDNAGYTIPVGTLVTIAAAGDEIFSFRTIEDVEVEAGKTATAAGEVVLQSVEPGEAANGLSDPPSLTDSLAFVDAIALTDVSAGGVDAEEEDAYLDRLVETLQLLSLSLILPVDFEIDARAVPGVARALCIPAYNAETKEEDVPLCVTVVAIDAAGLACGAPVKAELLARQAEKVPSGVLNFVSDPTHTSIDVELGFTVLPGYEPAAVEAAVEERLSTYLSPANWGLPSGFGDLSNSAGWELVDAVYRNELISEADRVPGLGRVVTLKLAKTGSPLEAQESVALAGIAPLTKAGAIKASAV
ncbi:MAG TPA: baseplate J/gp47 family protein [Solirubrobacterales bacterium]|nr:baseplate J/gp47 family protein [Solirubrobacterales bacterium]